MYVTYVYSVKKIQKQNKIYIPFIMNNRKRKGYENNYSSWILSQFRDVESRSNIFEQISSTIFTEESHVDPPLRDKKGRRIIMRESLYEDPDLFNFSFGSDHKLKRQFQCWVKSGEEPYTPSHVECEIIHNKQNKVEKNLNRMLAMPVQMTKAERMMKKMGWQGGALGKTGEGILEPITPNASYATKTIGLGQTAKRQKNSIQDKGCFKREREYFDTNVLLHVLDFVKNDSENEIVFHHHLVRKERKWAHKVVEALANNDQAVKTDFDTIAQQDIVQEIFKYNSYLLTTESEGVFPDRVLCLYKEAPENMYLVTPDDLKPEDDDDSEEVDKTKPNKLARDKGSTSNGTISNKKSVSVDEVLKTIIEYFTEFVEDDNYTELRFLGPFNDEEIDAINIFINKCTHYDFNANDLLKNVFKRDGIVMKENFNGNIIFCKSTKSP